MKSQPNRTRRLNRRLTAVDAGLGTRDLGHWSFLSWVWDLVAVVSCTTGLFLGNEFWPSFLCNFVTTNKSSDSVTETIPQCNSTSHRPTLMVDLKMARFGQCPLFHLPVFKILVKGLGPFWFFGGALLRIFFWPLPGPGPVFVTFRAKKKKLVGGDCSHHCDIPCSPKTVYLLTVYFCI